MTDFSEDSDAPRPYFDSNGQTIYLGDCVKILPHLGVGTIPLIFTSPPYNMGNSTGAGMHQFRGHYADDARLGSRGGSGKWFAPALSNGYDGYGDSMPHAEYVAWQREVLQILWLMLDEKGAIFYNHKPRIFSGTLCTPLEYNPGLPLRQIIIWARAGGINFNPTAYCSTHEWIMVLAKLDFRLKSQGASGAGDVWYVPQRPNKNHPAPFPIELPLTAIETTGAKLVLDPFAGSCTTLLAAKRLGVKAIGIELSEKYAEIGARSLEQSEFEFSEPGLPATSE